MAQFDLFLPPKRPWNTGRIIGAKLSDHLASCFRTMAPSVGIPQPTLSGGAFDASRQCT